VTFSTKKYSGPVRKSIQVISSDPEAARYRLQVSALVGSAPPTIGLNPETGIDFDRFPVDENQSATLELTNFSAEPMQIQIIGTPPEFLAAELSSEIIQPRETIELVVRTAEQPPLGRFSGAVTLLLDEARNTRLTIPISGVSMMK
jgi:hypothetical protein